MCGETLNTQIGEDISDMVTGEIILVIVYTYIQQVLAIASVWIKNAFETMFQYYRKYFASEIL